MAYGKIKSDALIYDNGGTDVEITISTIPTTAQVAAKADASALAAKADLVGGKLATSQIPDIALTTYLGAAANQTAMLAFTGQLGDWCSRSDLGTTFIITGSDPTSLASWTELTYPAAAAPTIDAGNFNTSGSLVSTSQTFDGGSFD